MIIIYSTSTLSVGKTGDSYKDSEYVLRNYTYMSLHIFRFIPFSIPFRFPFRVLVTPGVMMLLTYSIVDFHLFYDGAVIQI